MNYLLLSVPPGSNSPLSDALNSIGLRNNRIYGGQSITTEKHGWWKVHPDDAGCIRLGIPLVI